MQISLLQWNIWCDEPIDHIAEFINEIKPNIVCVQELTRSYHNNGDTGAQLSEKIGYKGIYRCGDITMPDGSAAQMGNGIFSRFTMHERAIVQHSGELKFEARTYLSVDLKTGGKKLTIATTHLPFRPTMRTTNRKKQLTAQIIDQAKTVDGPYILTGDFNSTPSSSVVKILKSQLQLTGPSVRQPTWTTKPATIAGIDFDQLKWRFDYVFHSSQIKMLDSKILSTEYSDHLPILCYFEI